MSSMKTSTKIASLAAGLALAAAPAFGHGTPPSHPSHPTHPATPKAALPGPNASLPAKANAYGVYCHNQSRLHSAAPLGTKGSPFSQCVNAMAKAAHTTAPTATAPQREKAAKAACKGMSKRHVKGSRGTSFSKCVAGAAKLLKTLHAQS